MELLLSRRTFSERSTVGDLYVDGALVANTLEDVVRAGPKIPGRTAIPEGRYEIVVNWSNRFKRPLPLLLDVPNFSGIRIHSGNTAEDTEGCILVGVAVGRDLIVRSRSTFEVVFGKIMSAIRREKIFITVGKEKADAT